MPVSYRAWFGVGLLIFFLAGAAGSWYFLRTPEAAPIVAIQPEPKQSHSVIGTSVEGRSIEAYSFGTGSTTLLFVGGIHGGYEWNSVALAYRFIDFLVADPEIVPENERVVVIPNINPDAVYAALGIEGRFVGADVAGKDLTKFRVNANSVDLNRNFDCNWSAEGVWQGKPEKTGTSAFSEPETRALRDYVTHERPDVVVFWHSKANAVYASQCNDGILPETLDVMQAYAHASDYTAVQEFDAYTVTGAGEDWLASQKIPAITVELSTHDSIEWEKNLRGIQALLARYARH